MKLLADLWRRNCRLCWTALFEVWPCAQLLDLSGDLSKDPRRQFVSLERQSLPPTRALSRAFLKGAAFFRYTCGTPTGTRRTMPAGSA